MKRMIAAALLAMLLTGSAGAYRVSELGKLDLASVEREADQEDEYRAEMLHDLGLLQGKAEGDFALNDPLTRAEAAALLTRFLGDEEQAISANKQSPFIDVPGWAKRYVGWLYANGLTKGVSETEYGAESPVSGRQFSLFLSRALCGGDEMAGQVLRPEERQALKENDETTLFVRKDAVTLMLRALTLESDGQTLARRLLDKGIFSAEEFCVAAWGKLPVQYGRNETGHIVNSFAGVPGFTSETDRLVLDTNTLNAEMDCLLAYRENGGEMEVYLLDPAVLTTKLCGTAPMAGGKIRADAYVATIDTRDYLYGPDGALLCRTYDQVKTVLDAETMKDASLIVQPETPGVPGKSRQIVVSTKKGQYLINVFTQDQLTPLSLAGKVIYQDMNYLVVRQSTANGDELVGYSLDADQETDRYPLKGKDEMRVAGAFLYGENGLYLVGAYESGVFETLGTPGRLSRLTERPALAVATTWHMPGIHSEPYILTYPDGKNSATQVAQVIDGEIKVLFDAERAGVTDLTLPYHRDESAVFFTAYRAEDGGTYEYAVLPDEILPTLFTPDDGVERAENMEMKEKARLAKLGYGVPHSDTQ